jgi:hypothetical protein
MSVIEADIRVLVSPHSQRRAIEKRILKLSDAIRFWLLLWHVIGFLPGEASGPQIWGSLRQIFAAKSIWRSPPELEHGPALGCGAR